MSSLNQFTWSQFLIWSAILIALYFILQVLYRLLRKARFLGGVQEPLKRTIHIVLLIGEPLAILLLGTVFILINLVFHGVLILLILILGFEHIRNYVSGQIIKIDANLTEGKQIHTQNIEGIVDGIEKLGLRIKTRKGRRYVHYTTLFDEGYILFSGENIGGYYQLQLEPAVPAEKENTRNLLMDRLAFSPYLDWNHKPELLPRQEEDSKYKVNVIVKEETHLYDLISQIKGWGFNCKIITK